MSIAIGIGSMGILSLLPFNAGATSAYGVSTTSTIHVGSDTCGTVDMTQNWAEAVNSSSESTSAFNYNDPATWLYKASGTYSSDNTFYGPDAPIDAFASRYASNLAAGSGWAVQQVSVSGHEGIRIYLFDPSATWTFSDHTLNYSAGTLQQETFYYSDYWGCSPYLGYTITAPTYSSGISTDAGPFLLFNSAGITYPSDYSGSTIPSTGPAIRKYVALGDSFASGEGNPPFDTGTAVTSGSNEDQCHRSGSAYPYMLAQRLGLNLTHFVACSGANTDTLTNGGLAGGSWGEGPQVNVLSTDTDIVTLTIGGNDVGFDTYATACTEGLCDFSTQAYTDIHNAITNNLPSKLADAYRAIDNATSSNARIYVLGYPNILPAEMPTGINSACWPFNGGLNNTDSTQNNGAAAYAIETLLNTTIAQAVSDYGSSKFQYIDANAVGSPFIGHDWCSTDKYFANVALLYNTEYSYHPTATGQEVYARLAADAIR